MHVVQCTHTFLFACIFPSVLFGNSNQTVEATLVLLQAKAVEERKVQVNSGKGERERLFILGKVDVSDN